MYRRGGKRLFDLALALPVLVVLSPLLALMTLLVRLDSRGPVLFMQERLGRGGTTFSAYKFRTMTDRPRVPDRQTLHADPEITRVGHWLRRSKLDELPQLLNVLKGDMSIVGPRPALPIHLAEYDELARKRLAVRPGLTGLAQVNGNIYLSWPERWHYDAEYVKHLSFRLDMWIILRTAAVIVLGEQRFLNRPSRA